MLETLRKTVLQANRELVERGLVFHTFGNASGIDRKRGLVVIKPSGVPYQKLDAERMVIVDLNGHTIEGDLNPSSDTATHLELYRGFPEIGGVVHTHSTWATSWAQAGRNLPALGTTHADYFHGDVPCTRGLTGDEVAGAYEKNTGRVILETFRERDPLHIPGVFVCGHGPFTWGPDPHAAVFNGVMLEELVRMACITTTINPSAPSIPDALVDKHFLRKHGHDAYYGQDA